MRTVRIFGDGIAGLSAARMLTALGQRVTVTGAGPIGARCVVLNAASSFLLERIWDRDLVQRAALHALEQRIVTWEGITPACVEDRGIITDVAALCRLMRSILDRDPMVEWDDANREFDIVAAKLDDGGFYLSGGERHAVQASAWLVDGAYAHSMLVEAVPTGWLVGLPIGNSEATLMGVGRRKSVCLDTLLEASTLCRAAVRDVGPTSEPTGAAPRLFVASRTNQSVKRIGDVGMRLDPLCGDGIGSSLRSAHLAALLNCRARDATDFHANMLYEQRLAQALRAHLRGLAWLYQAAPLERNWAIELDAMEAMDRLLYRLSPAETLPIAVMEDSLLINAPMQGCPD